MSRFLEETIAELKMLKEGADQSAPARKKLVQEGFEIGKKSAICTNVFGMVLAAALKRGLLCSCGKCDQTAKAAAMDAAMAERIDYMTNQLLDFIKNIDDEISNQNRKEESSETGNTPLH